MTVYSAAITLFLVMDSIGNIPVFVSLLKGIAPKRQMLITVREMFIAFLVLLLFLYFGGPILKGLNITEASLEIAGGIILFIIAIKMIFPNRTKGQSSEEEELEGEPLIVPLAIPLMAGPSALATVLLFATQEPERMTDWIAAVVLASIASLIVLIISQPLMRVLGKRGLIAIERLMGMILTTISVQMFLNGVKVFFVQ